MRTETCGWFLLAVVACGCAAPTPLPHLEQVPPLPIDMPGAALEPTLRAAADRSPPLPESGSPLPAAASQGPIYQTVTRVIEVPAPAPEPESTVVTVPVRYDYGYGYSYDVHPYNGDRYHRHGRDDWFPASTLLGAGIGAVIGNQHSRRWRDRGALIGAGYGLLFDLPRWLR